MLICVEEHAVDGEIDAAAMPAQDREAPYRRDQSTAPATPEAGGDRLGQVVDIRDAVRMGADLGESRLRAMDDNGIDMQVVSYTSPVQLVPEHQAVGMVRAANDRLAAAAAAHPDRYRAFAALPWQSPGAAADELDRAVTELGMVGTLLMGRPGETFLDDPRYAPVLERLARLRVPLYLHPFVPHPRVQQVYYAGLADQVSTEFSLGAWGWHHEAGIHLLRLILSGAFDRYPDLQVISGHWGEMVPYHLSRLDQVLSPRVTGLSRTITETFRSQVWVSPSGIFDEPHFAFVRDTVGLDRLLWSVDYPYIGLTGARAFLDALPLDDREREQVSSGNARRLFGI